MDAMVVPAVGPIVVVSRTIPEVVTPIVIVVTRVPERAVVVVVVPTIVIDVINVDVGIAVVPVGPVVVVSPIPIAPIVIACAPVIPVAPVVVAVAPIVAVAPVVVPVAPVVAVAVPIGTVPTASTTGSVAVVDNAWKRLNTAGPIATSDGRSIGLGRWTILPADIGSVWATDWPVAVDVRSVAIRIIAVADVTAETRSGLGRQLAVTP